MVNQKRWKLAQDKEKKTWENPAHDLSDSDYKISKDYLKLIKKYLTFTKKSRILEIGCGTSGMISCIPRGERYGLDPLMNFFKSNNRMLKDINWIDGKGEDLSFKNSFFDIILMCNVLDHAENPKKILEEIFRTLKEKGYLFLTLNVYSSPICFTKNFLEFVRCGDPCHPYTFSINKIKKMLSEKNFKILYEKKVKRDGKVKKIKDENNFEKFKRYLKEDGLFFTIRLAIGNIIYKISNKIFRYQKEGAIILAQKMNNIQK